MEEKELEALHKELTSLKSQARTLDAQIETVRRSIRKIRADEFIRANGVTRADVQMSCGDGVPLFMLMQQFAEWMTSRGSLKRFAEWNQRIYFTTDLVAGRMPDMPATIDDLPTE